MAIVACQHEVALPPSIAWSGLPARALRTRLQFASEASSSWATYLPPLLLKQGTQNGDERTAKPPSMLTASEFAPLKDASEHFQASGSWWFGRIWSLSRDKFGCREVQDALQLAASDEERLAMAMELSGHIHEAMRCPHANFVLQKCVAVMSPPYLQFVVDELLCKGAGPVTQAARHKYGCRIIQRLLERCPEEQVHRLVDCLFVDALAICLHPYGNYVMQHLLEYGSPVRQHQLTVRVLAQHAGTVGMDGYGCAVVGKAFAHGAQADQVTLARSLLQARGSLSLIARSRNGGSAKAILQLLNGAELDEAKAVLACI